MKKAVVMVMIMMRLGQSNDGSVIWIRDVSRPPVKQQRPLIMLILYHTDIQWDLHIIRTFTFINRTTAGDSTGTGDSTGITVQSEAQIISSVGTSRR